MLLFVVVDFVLTRPCRRSLVRGYKPGPIIVIVEWEKTQCRRREKEEATAGKSHPANENMNNK